MSFALKDMFNPTKLVGKYLGPHVDKDPIFWGITLVVLSVLALIAICVIGGNPLTLPLMTLTHILPMYGGAIALGGWGAVTLAQHLLSHTRYGGTARKIAAVLMPLFFFGGLACIAVPAFTATLVAGGGVSWFLTPCIAGMIIPAIVVKNYTLPTLRRERIRERQERLDAASRKSRETSEKQRSELEKAEKRRESEIASQKRDPFQGEGWGEEVYS